MSDLIVPTSIIEERIRRDFRGFFAAAKRLAGPKHHRKFEATLLDWLLCMSGEKRDVTYRTVIDEIGRKKMLSARGRETVKRMLGNYLNFAASEAKAKEKRDAKTSIIYAGG